MMIAKTPVTDEAERADISANKNIEYYLALPYTFEVIQEDETTWFARVKELPGCITEADSAEEAFQMIRDAQLEWLDAAIESGYPIPEPLPISESDFSGRFNVRIPKTLHRDVVRAAEADGVSLNQFVNVAIAKAVASAPR